MIDATSLLLSLVFYLDTSDSAWLLQFDRNGGPFQSNILLLELALPQCKISNTRKEVVRNATLSLILVALDEGSPRWEEAILSQPATGDIGLEKTRLRELVLNGLNLRLPPLQSILQLSLGGSEHASCHEKPPASSPSSTEFGRTSRIATINSVSTRFHENSSYRQNREFVISLIWLPRNKIPPKNCQESFGLYRYKAAGSNVAVSTT